MAVTSVRGALTCMGQGGIANPSVMRDVLGYARGTQPTDPSTNAPVTVSLGQMFTGLSGRRVHMNMIRVGFDLLGSTAFGAAIDQIDYATFRTRNIYATRSLGLGRIQHWEISAAASRGRDDIADGDEADSLFDEWSVPNDGVDMFIVRTIGGTLLGKAADIPGDCSKGDKDDAVLGGAVDDPSEGMSRTAAHELGHYLGLSHNHGDDCPTDTGSRMNLMAQTRCVPNISGTTTRDVRGAVNLSTNQGSTVRGHCFTRGGC